MSLTILNVSYPLAPVGPDAVGGAEQVLTSLDTAVVRAGHRSIVIAPEGSRAAGVLVPTPRPPNALDAAAHEAAQQHHREAIRYVLAQWQVDVIHMHGLDYSAYVPVGQVPVIATLHLPLRWYTTSALSAARANTHLVCVSAFQKSRLGGVTAQLPVIENGVDLGPLPASSRPRTFAVALGRICPEKGFEYALDAAHRADVPLLLAGHVFGYPDHQEYFRALIRPRLDRRRRFIGAAGRTKKRRLLSAARCLLVPSIVDETSSLVAMESLACGTPVVAFKAGALAGIVENGRTGFLVESAAEMADAIRAVDEIDPGECRAAAEERFSASRMAESYFRMYERLASPSSAVTAASA